MSNKEIKHGVYYTVDNELIKCFCQKDKGVGEIFGIETFNNHIHQETMKQVEEIVNKVLNKDINDDGLCFADNVKKELLNKLKELSNE